MIVPMFITVPMFLTVPMLIIVSMFITVPMLIIVATFITSPTFITLPCILDAHRTAGRRMAVCVPNLLRNEGVPEWVSDSPGKPREAQGTQGGAQGGAWRPPL